MATALGAVMFVAVSAQTAGPAADSAAGSAAPQPGDAKKGPAPRKSTTINFEDQLVEGQAQKPELFYMLKQKNANFKKLIRLREDFLPEMKKTAGDVERKGSGN